MCTGLALILRFSVSNNVGHDYQHEHYNIYMPLTTNLELSRINLLYYNCSEVLRCFKRANLHIRNFEFLNEPS